jgi:hypothetical protein
MRKRRLFVFLLAAVLVIDTWCQTKPQRVHPPKWILGPWKNTFTENVMIFESDYIYYKDYEDYNVIDLTDDFEFPDMEGGQALFLPGDYYAVYVRGHTGPDYITIFYRTGGSEMYYVILFKIEQYNEWIFTEGYVQRLKR